MEVIPNSCEMKIVYSISGLTMINKVGAQGAASANVNQALADALDASVKAAFTSSGFAGLIKVGDSLQQITIRSRTSETAAEFLGGGAPVAGTAVAGETLPRGSSCVVTLKTAQAGKSYRGRVFLPPVIETQNDASGNQSTASQTTCLAWVNAIRSSLSSNGLTMAVLSPSLPQRTTTAGTVLPAKPAFSTPVVTTAIRHPQWASQRRRNHRA